MSCIQCLLPPQPKTAAENEVLCSGVFFVCVRVCVSVSVCVCVCLYHCVCVLVVFTVKCK